MPGAGCRRAKRAGCVRCCVRVMHMDGTLEVLRYRLLLLPPGSALACRLLEQLPQVRCFAVCVRRPTYLPNSVCFYPGGISWALRLSSGNPSHV